VADNPVWAFVDMAVFCAFAANNTRINNQMDCKGRGSSVSVVNRQWTERVGDGVKFLAGGGGGGRDFSFLRPFGPGLGPAQPSV
jgi:hypothetical protein